MPGKAPRAGNMVLVAVLPNRRDLNILLNKNWYRIPAAYRPKRKFHYIAFYQPAAFSHQGKAIRYYARAVGHQTKVRRLLLPEEPHHPRANNHYVKIRVSNIKKLARPIRNIIPRRISFGFTTLERLLKSKNILQLYNVVPTEQIIKNSLRRAGIKALAQYYVVGEGKRYRLDFAILCRNGSLAIECDNKKAHAGSRRLAKDKAKDEFLINRGWTVMRLPEQDIIYDLDRCILKITLLIRKLGGLA